MGKNRTHRSLSILKRQFKYRKPICPFICSTFQDFQVERDILVKKVFPSIDAICRERGTYCAPVDLRWGINDYQASSGQVINLCLDYVTKCAPFFICILGERYGSCRPANSPPLPKSYKDLSPNAHWMDRNLVIAAALGYDWVATEPYSNSSVTELEIAQRNFLASEVGDDFSFYYVRQQEHLDHLFIDLPEGEREQNLKMYQPESDYSNRRVRELKTQIAKRGLPLKYFKTPEELQLLVLCDWKAVVDCLYPPFYDDIPQTYMNSVNEWICHEAFAESRRRVYISTPELAGLFNDLTEFALTSLEEPPPMEDEKPISRAQSYSSLLRRKKQQKKQELLSTLLLIGERGCGKSSVIANWYRSFEENYPEVKVITHFVGSSAQSTDLHSLMRRFTQEIRNEYPDIVDIANDISEADVDASEFHNVCESFHAALTLGPCVLVLDGVDELAECYGCSYKKVKGMSWLPYPLPPQCKVIITCASSDTAHKTLSQRDDIKILSVPLLNDAKSKSKVVREYLAIHCKCLDKAQLNHIVSSKLSDRPIFLTVLANELRMFGVYSRLDHHLESYLDALSIRDLWSKIILRWVKDYSWPSEQGTKSESGDNETGEITGWIADALRLIACSRNGLTRDEILDILKELGYNGNTKVTVLDWALFRSAAMDSLLERPEGLISFFHQHFKEAVEHTLLGSSTPAQSHSCDKHIKKTIQELDYSVAISQKKSLDRCHFHKHIGHYFLKQKTDNRQLVELPWQLERAGEFDQLATVLSEPRIFLEMAGDGIMNHKRLELVKYWKILEHQGYSVQKTYWDMLKRALGRDNELGSTESIVEGSVNSSITSASTMCHLPLSVMTRSTLRPSIPQILRTSPSVSIGELSTDSDLKTEEQNSEEDMSVVDSSRSSSSASLLSDKSRSSIGSYTSSEIDINEAFIDGRARGPKAMAKLTMSTGQFLSIMSCFTDAEKMLLAAHEKLGQISFSGDCQHLLCGLEESLGNMYLFQLRKGEAVHWFTRALTTVEELLIVLRNSDDEKGLIEMKGRLLARLGSMCTHNKKFEKAEMMLTRARACFEEARCCTGKASVQYHIGYLRMQQGDFEMAESLLTEALVNFERWFGKSYPRLAEIINDLANLLCHPDNKTSQDLIQAEHLYRRALHIRETCFGSDHLLVATSLFHLGILLKKQPERSAQQEALTLLEQALDIRMTKLGEKHVLTKNVRRTLNDLQVRLRTQNKFTSDKRSTELPHSSLTWHDNELQSFERSAKQKADKEKLKKATEKTPDELSTASVMTQQSDDFTTYRTDLSGVVSKQGITTQSDSQAYMNKEVSDCNTKVDQAPKGESNQQENLDAYQDYIPDEITGGTSEMNGLSCGKQRPNPYLDSFVFQISDQQTPRYKTARPHSTMLPTKPSIYNTRCQNRDKEGHTLSDTLGYYASLGDQRRIQSAPPCNRTPIQSTSVSNVYHRMSCPAPDPHSINLSNSYSVVYGPNTSIESLLGCRDSPRYNNMASSAHHGSAWYPPPGRYTTNKWLCPRKRLQRRANQNKLSLINSSGRVSRTSISPKELMYPDNTNIYRSTTRAVHFDGNNLETVHGRGLLAH